MAKTESKGELDQLIQRKLELGAEIRRLETEIRRVNLELHRQGAEAKTILCW